jgi:proteasome lid subunit RPN8/RPN11
VVLSRFRTRRLVVPERSLSQLRTHVVEEHPREAGGYLVCEREGTSLRAVDTVRLDNEADRPLRRFETTLDTDSVPEMPRVFYHSHTTPASPSSLTRPDRRLTERFQLVVFAPTGEPGSYRLFRRGLFNWVELVAEGEHRDTRSRLPRLV